MDVESIKIIESFEGAKLTTVSWDYARANLGLGVKSEQEYSVLSGRLDIWGL